MTRIDAPAPLLPEILSLHGKWRATKPAVIFEGRELTWGEFEARTNRVANALINLGLEKGDCVILLMENGFEMLDAIFGAIKAGAVVAPLNLSVSDAGVAAMIRDAGARAVIAGRTQTARLDTILGQPDAPDVAHVIAVGGGAGLIDFADWCGEASPKAPEVALGDDDPCNIIYSSGTTGLPKGIVHSHRRRLDWAYDLAIALRYHGGVRTICPIGLYSNISWISMLCTLLAGGTLVVLPKFDPQGFFEAVERHRVTHGSLVPIIFRELVEHEGARAHDLSSLEALMSAGSPLYGWLKARARDVLGCRIIELYGLTEGVITTLEPEDMERKIDSVGQPLLGTDLCILGADDRPLPAGEPGEVVARGRILMPGYHNRTDATQEALWIDDQGRHWLRTGDIGKLDEDGFLYIVDRKKDMILSGGQNIYPADIEAVIVTHEGVRDAAVIGVRHRKWGEAPLALVVPAKGAALDAQALKAWINARVGKQQRVVDVELVAELKRNPNGKLPKVALRKRYATREYGE